MTELEKIVYDERIYGCAYFKYEAGSIVRIDPTTIRFMQPYKPVVMQSEASASAEGAAVASEGQGEANMRAGKVSCIKCGKSFATVTKLWNHFDRCRG